MKTLWNEGWLFLKLPVDAGLSQAKEKAHEFAPVEIPHDWLIYDAQNLYEDGTGWYKKSFSWRRDSGRMFVTFDGVYMDSTIWVNGRQAGEWKYGYSSFTLDLTAFLQEGDNEIIVCARHQSPNSRWYSGAGIYRNVWVRMTGENYIETNGIYVHSEPSGDFSYWILTVETRFVGKGEVRHELQKLSADDRISQCELPIGMSRLSAEVTGTDKDGVSLDRQTFLVNNPECWDVEHPNLYRLTTTLVPLTSSVWDRESTVIGFRTAVLDAKNGFFLNGRRLKLNGVCEHHDLGALGAAFNRAAQRRKFTILKKMGVNAIRFAHNMPAPECLELADEMGFLVIDEAFDMWERPKTTYDYARFFDAWHERDMESFVTRDRNHPCVVFWSIGNEIYDTHADAERGTELVQELAGLVRRYDALGNAYVTFGSNYMPWENTQKCAAYLQAVGYNYSEKYYEEHHEKYPKWVIYGSETSSIVQSRGIYHFPLETGILSDDDRQCSALGNSATSWGAKSMEECACVDRDTPFSLGQFLWSGTDYIGEPTPYHTKNSYFGQIDTAGFPKDSYYVYQSVWTDCETKPMIHIFPYWDFNPGQTVDVRVCSNADSVELFLNGRSLGRQELTHAPDSGKKILADYKVSYEEGALLAVAYDKDGREICRQERRSFMDSAKIVAKADKTTLAADGRDMMFVEISTVDRNGHPVENAVDRVNVQVEGAGRLAGLDNGDSTDYDSYKGTSRRLFSGKLLAMVMATREAGDIRIRVSGKGLEEAVLTARSVTAGQSAESLWGGGNVQNAKSVWDDGDVQSAEGLWGCGNTETPVVLGAKDEIPVRKILLRYRMEHGDMQRELGACGKRNFLCPLPETALSQPCITPESGTVEVTAYILPETATDKSVEFGAVNNSGVTSNLAEVRQEGNKAYLSPLGDGAFKLRCVSKSGSDAVRVISELNFETKGFGEAYLNPYGFVAGSMYTRTNGNESAGNERGVATGRDGETIVTYDRLDFGKAGSDRITVPIFALDSEAYPIQIWEGVPGEDGELVADVVYQKPSIWNVYQEDSWTLNKRLTGLTTISFLLRQKVHIKGFSFQKEERAYMRLVAASADEIYGDSFIKKEPCVEQIGNNVSLVWHDMDFGEQGTKRLAICGRAAQGANSIHVRFQNGDKESKQIVEFPMSGVYEEHAFVLEKITGRWDVSFVFMPGSCFDFKEFVFGDVSGETDNQ